MGFFLFYCGPIWFLIEFLSLLSGHVDKVERARIRQNLRAECLQFTLGNFPKKIVVLFSFTGMLFPVAYPLRAIALSLISTVVFSIYVMANNGRA